MEEKLVYSFQTDLLYILRYIPAQDNPLQMKCNCYFQVTASLLRVLSCLSLQVLFIELKVVPAILTHTMLQKGSLSYFNTCLSKPDL